MVQSAARPSAPTVLYCPNHHLMQGKVTREMWNMVAWKHYETSCNMCSAKILADDARYFCKDCKYSVCTECSSALLGRQTNTAASAIYQNHFFNAPTAGVGE